MSSKISSSLLIKKFHHVRHVMMKKSIRWNITVIKSPNYAVYLCFIDLMKFHQTNNEILSNQCWTFIKSEKILKLIWRKFYKFMTEIHQIVDEFSSKFIVKKGKKKRGEARRRTWDPLVQCLILYPCTNSDSFKRE